MRKKLHITEGGAQKEIVSALKLGGVVVLPTDTLYGFSTPLSSESGIRRIASIKGNGQERKFIFLADGIAMVECYIASWGCVDRNLFEDIWPAPFTAILPSGKNTPTWIGETIAFRVPAFPALVKIIHALGEPIISTSTNRAGEPPMLHLDEIEQNYGDKVDLIVAGEEVTQRLSSTIVDFTGEAPMLVREGIYPWDMEDENPSNW